MVTGQLSILDLAAGPQPAAPRCRMCARPARWLATQQQYAMYCAGKACSNRERMCQACESSFVMNVNGAGTKYCSTACKAAGYRVANAFARQVTCAWCGKVGGKVRATSNRVWPYICNVCLAPINHLVHRLKAHHVPHERARQLLTDPGCEVCGRDIVAKTRIDADTGRPKASLVVDHDHGCCPVTKYSCGACVRGLLCMWCNSAAGMLGEASNNAKSLAAYLARFSR